MGACPGQPGGREASITQASLRVRRDVRPISVLRFWNSDGLTQQNINCIICKGGIIMPIGNFPEMLSQRNLAGIILVGRLGNVGCRLASWRAVSRRTLGRGRRVPALLLRCPVTSPRLELFFLVFVIIAFVSQTIQPQNTIGQSALKIRLLPCAGVFFLFRFASCRG